MRSSDDVAAEVLASAWNATLDPADPEDEDADAAMPLPPCMPSGLPWTNRLGLAWKRRAQPSEQKWYATPSCRTVAAARAGSILMPQTGSRTRSVAIGTALRMPAQKGCAKPRGSQ